MAETNLSHRLTAYKIFRLSYRKISGSNQVKNCFFTINNISVPCPQTQLRGRTVIKKFWTFFGPWGRDRSQSPPCWIFRVKLIHPSTASERTTRQQYPCLKRLLIFFPPKIRIVSAIPILKGMRISLLYPFNQQPSPNI